MLIICLYRSKVFSHFSLYPEAVELQGIVQRPNETLSRSEFEDFQNHCAQRGVTVVPEIEAPGHCLSITKCVASQVKLECVGVLQNERSLSRNKTC
jgi:hypothetical protein